MENIPLLINKESINDNVTSIKCEKLSVRPEQCWNSNNDEKSETPQDITSLMDFF